jgi:hypothetical protein
MPIEIPQPPLEDPGALEAPAMTPERAAYVMGALTALARVLLDGMLADLEVGQLSTGSTAGADSLTDRLMVRALRPWIPKLRATFLDKLSVGDPAMVERLMGATSTTIETILADAPGEPMPRWAWEWLPGQERPSLVPLDPRA